MKVSKRDVLLLVAFLGILAAVCSYVFVFQPTMEKAEAMKQENLELQARIADLQSKADNRDSYENETARMKKEIEEIYQLFPVDVREENAILLAINQELIAPLQVNTITIESLVDVPFLTEEEAQEETQISYEIDAVEELEDYEGTQGNEEALTVGGSEGFATVNPLGLKNRRSTISYDISYEALKRSVKHIAQQTDRMVIENLTVTYNESTGLLTGSTAVNMFCVPGQEGKEYVQPNFSGVLLGKDNIFGTVVISSEGDLPDLEDGEEAEAETNTNTARTTAPAAAPAVAAPAATETPAPEAQAQE